MTLPVLSPRTWFGRPVPPRLDLFLDHAFIEDTRTHRSLCFLQRLCGRLGWMLVGAALVSVMYIAYAPRWVESWLASTCHTLTGPEADGFFAGQGIMHDEPPWNADQIAAWERARRTEKPQPITRPFDAWRVCETWAPVPETRP